MPFEKALILHRYKYSETSLLLKLFTREQGVVPVIAKGARSAKSRIRGLCEPFVPILVEMSGRGEVKSLRKIELDYSLKPFGEKGLLSALYLNELLIALLPTEEPVPWFFDRYAATLKRLSEGELSQALREFEWHLLAECGYELSIVKDHEESALEALGFYQVMPGQLPVKTNQDQGDHIYRGAALLSIAAGELSNPEVRQVAKRLLRQWLDFYSHGKLIKSRRLLRSYYEQ